jgi:hypothetical protein
MRFVNSAAKDGRFLIHAIMDGRKGNWAAPACATMDDRINYGFI